MNREGAGGPPKEVDGGDDGSANLWHTLRRSFLCMVSVLLEGFFPPLLLLCLGGSGMRDGELIGVSVERRTDMIWPSWRN